MPCAQEIALLSPVYSVVIWSVQLDMAKISSLDPEVRSLQIKTYPAGQLTLLWS